METKVCIECGCEAQVVVWSGPYHPEIWEYESDRVHFCRDHWEGYHQKLLDKVAGM